MLSAGELEAMRDTTETALPDTAIIQTQTLSSDGGGAYDTVWSNAGTVDCRIAPIGRLMDERETGGRISEYADFVVTLPFDSAVTTDSRLLISGGTYNVSAIRSRSWHVSRRVEVVKQT